MGLKRTKLIGITSVSGLTANPIGIFTSGTTQTAAGVAGTTYIRSIVTHNTSGIHTACCSIYVAPNGVTAANATVDHKISQVNLDPTETYFFDYAYPMVLTNGDKICVDVVHPVLNAPGFATNTQMNFQILGDTSA